MKVMKSYEINQSVKKKIKRKNHVIYAIIIISLHLGGSLVFLETTNFGQHKFFGILGIDGKEFLSKFFLSGVFLYFLFIVLRFIGMKGDICRISIVVVSSALVFSILLAAEKFISHDHTHPNSVSELIYIIITEHNAILVLIILSLFFGFTGVYYIIKNILSIQYSTTGIHIKLSGQSMYYLPIFPQKSWQNTKIKLKKGEKYWVELYGQVSPGALQQLQLLKTCQDIFDNSVICKKNTAELEDYGEKFTWPYTGPEGYPERFYSKEGMREVFKTNDLYKNEYYYQKDSELTIMGLTHNKVVGYIKDVDDPADEPRIAKNGIKGYNWNDPEDRKKLILFSKKRYPFVFKAKKSGELYVVINDVDRARWDNVGLFFLKVTKRSLFS